MAATDPATAQACGEQCKKLYWEWDQNPERLQWCMTNCAYSDFAAGILTVTPCLEGCKATYMHGMDIDTGGFNACAASCKAAADAATTAALSNKLKVVAYKPLLPTKPKLSSVSPLVFTQAYAKPFKVASSASSVQQSAAAGIPTWAIVLGIAAVAGLGYYFWGGKKMSRNPRRVSGAKGRRLIDKTAEVFKQAGLIRVRKGKSTLYLADGHKVSTLVQGVEPMTGNVSVLTTSGHVLQYFRREVV